MRRRLPLLALLLLPFAPTVGRAADRLASAFSTVGVLNPNGETPSVTLYVVPEGRTFVLTDVLIANHGQEVGPLYLADSGGTRCAIELLQTTLIGGNAGGFFTLSNPHTTFTSGIPFGPGEPVIATLANGTHGVDVTISGKLIPALITPKAVRIPGGARGEPATPLPDAAPVP